MISIIDYGAGNLRSVAKAFERVGANPTITSNEKIILNSHGVVLPGVGAFSDCMKSLVDKGMDRVVRTSIEMGKPFLGICLGFQMLFESSEEHEPGLPDVEGLGIFRGKVRKFPGTPDLKVPHMGWNNLIFQKPTALFDGLDHRKAHSQVTSSCCSEVTSSYHFGTNHSSPPRINPRNNSGITCPSKESYFYFVHSYYVDAYDKSIVWARADYGIQFDAAIAKENIFGVQFHPEKSGENGLTILKNFLKVVRKA